MLKPKILIADDEIDIREVFTEYLELKGFEVEEASTGEEALEKLRRSSDFDLLVTDLNMPAMSGIELIEKIRTDNNPIPVIIITGFPSIDSAINAIKEGANDYLVKPINLEEILIKVNRIIAENRLKKESIMLKDLAIFLDFIFRISISSDLNRILEEIDKFILEHTGADGIYFYIDYMDQYGLSYKEQASRNFDLEKPKLDIIKEIIKASSTASFFTADEKNFKEIRKNSSVTNFSILPLKTYRNFLGGIIIYKMVEPFADLSRQLFKMLSNQISSIIENYILYKRMRINYLSTIEALADAVDKKDQYTHYHSKNVMKLALELGKATSLSHEDLDTLRYAALLHDIGKIGVSENILNKKGKLTTNEYDKIKMHSQFGANIIENIPTMRHLVPHIRFHHERIDGQGYPEGLVGENIPPIAKIISVADTFEAMNSNRVYRKALPLEVIRAELVRVSGEQLDEIVVSKLIHIIDNNLLPDLK